MYKGGGMCGVVMHVCKGGGMCGVVMHVCVEKSPIKTHRVTDRPFKNLFKFNFSQTVGEMVFVSFEVENVFSSVNSSLVLGLSVVMGCSSLLSCVKPLAKVWFRLALVSWPSCRQQASLFMHRHGRAAFPFLLQILLLFQILGHQCHIFQCIKDPPI